MKPKTKLEEAIDLISLLGIPIKAKSKRRQELMALALLAVANMKPNTPWKEAAIFDTANPKSSWKLTTREIISFWNNYWGQKVSSGSYDDVRRKHLAYLTAAEVVLAAAGDQKAATNNPTRRYAVSPSALDALRKYGTPAGIAAAETFKETVGDLEERLKRPRPTLVTVKAPDGQEIALTLGKHNDLQKAIIEEFLPRFVGKPKLLYVGDTAKKQLKIDEDALLKLGFKRLAHDMLPDIVVYDEKNNWIFLIEAVHSSNPISELRHLQLEDFTKNCTASRVYVSVFANRSSFRKWVTDISWETEVWLVDAPHHMIHFNGEKFLGPHKHE